MKLFRCPTCLLIPRIINLDYRTTKIFFRYLCSNNHSKIINYKNIKKFNLAQIKCNECNNINNQSEYYCTKCFNILCKSCKKIHQELKNHKNIIDINIIDNNCFIHNEVNILYCNNCEENICNKCIKSQKHKGHEINELKLLDLKDFKENCIKFKKNIGKKFEDLKLDIIKNKFHYSIEYKDNNKIHNYIKELKNINLDIADYLLDMINDFDQYKKEKKFPNYIIYLNSKIIGSFISSVYKYFEGYFGQTIYIYKSWYCKKYEIYKSNLLKDYIKENEFFYNTNLTNRTILNYSRFQNIHNIHYSLFYMNENNEGILIYLKDKILCYRNIETLNDFKKILIDDLIINIDNIKSTRLIRFNRKEYLLIDDYLGSFEVFLIYNAKSEKISSVIKKGDQQGNTFNSEFLLTSINYFNKKIYATCFYKHKIYIYNILLNQIEIAINSNDEILYRYNKYFTNNINNIYDFLFITTDKQCIIYELKKFSVKKKLFYKDIYYVLLSEFLNKSCIFISTDFKLIIIDFITDDILYEIYAYKTQCLFLWNKYTIIENYQIDSCAGSQIIDLFDGKRKDVFENDFWWTEEIFRIKLKNYGDCLLRIGEDKTNLFYIRPDSEIEKKKEELKKFNLEEMIDFPDLFD